ncbi:MAG: BrnT family toxin [Crocosphaera sp.]
MSFEYDPQKAKSNEQKHGISFAEAEMVFFDPFAIHDIDPDSITEERFIAVGMGNKGSLLVVVYTLRGDIIRLISARHATKQERKTYETTI